MEIITLVVNTTADENDGSESGAGLSLRDAVIIAQQSPENEYVIEVQGGETYTLEINGGDGNSGDLDILGNVTIRATGDEPATIDASGLTTPDRVIDVLRDSNVTLNNLVITGGIAEQNSLGENGQDFGGGLRVLANANVNITNSEIAGNVARNIGGGIYSDSDSTVNLVNSEVTDNQANGDGGGGIWNSSASFTIRDSKVSRNSHNSNQNIGLFTGGGGILNRVGELTIENSEINDNFSVRGGGGIENESISSTASLSISNSTISGNVASGNGGGILAGDQTTITSSTISNNIAQPELIAGNGGGISVIGSVVAIADTTISNNTATNGGGGLQLADGEVFIISSTISNNLAEGQSSLGGGDGGGGIINGFTNGGGDLFLINSTVSGNVSHTNGGGISSPYIDFSYQRTFLYNSTVVNNTANGDRDDLGVGGGIFNPVADNLILSNSIISGNLQGAGDAPSDFYGTVNGDSNNLVGSLNDVEGTIGTGSDRVDPDLGLTPLQDNGGLTPTHAPLNGSPAIDGGNNTGIVADSFDLDGDGDSQEATPFDQLNNQRIFGEAVDIGAVEFGSTPAETTPPDAIKPDLDTTKVDVYRFLRTDTQTQFYTTTDTERQTVLDTLPQYELEGISFVGVADPITGTSPVYRFFNTTTGVHLYTADENERAFVGENLDNFVFEGTPYYGYDTQVEGTVPLYRFYNASLDAHFYTPSTVERDAFIESPDYEPEGGGDGIAFYVEPAPDL